MSLAAVKLVWRNVGGKFEGPFEVPDYSPPPKRKREKVLRHDFHPIAVATEAMLRRGRARNRL